MCLSAVSETAKRLDATKRWLVALSPPNIWARAYKSIARQQRFRTNDDASVHRGLHGQLDSCTARRPTLDKIKRVRVVTHTGCSDYPNQFQVHREVGKICSPRCLHHTYTYMQMQRSECGEPTLLHGNDVHLRKFFVVTKCYSNGVTVSVIAPGCLGLIPCGAPIYTNQATVCSSDPKLC